MLKKKNIYKTVLMWLKLPN